ncbi:hypothetical protein [Ammoniphilus sp. CFH 90114]|uniref:hypothetical protein n=1 Tax=Ammoniphilus sp. CFH 90114 TaxID=2493665 RepID=UPI00100EAE6A|nr:hypothetical protein [Ammoniphilus sp. CFH 90114]RXT15138.1 hypothetical protein EIZ39_02710 [Ammoniphilus sp. CFH 90114]
MGKYVINLIVAATVFLFTLLTSLANNTFSTSLVRASFGFVLFFIIMFPISWYFLRKSSQVAEVKEAKAGQSINAATPDENLLQKISEERQVNSQASEKSNEFVPLAPPTIKKKEPSASLDSEEIANAVRILSNQ